MLELKGVETYYGSIQALFGMSFHAAEGEVTTLIGRNGMGKTTTVGSILGTVPSRKGEITFLGKRIDGQAAYKVAQRGIGLVPEGRQIFPNLSVRENLIATSANYSGDSDPWTLEKVLEFFPALRERMHNLGSQLSGGEQQMLAIGRALMSRPKVLLLDEPSLGLAPLIVQKIFEIINEINREDGTTILLVEQNANIALQTSQRGYVLETGAIIMEDQAQSLLNNPDIRKAYLGES